MDNFTYTIERARLRVLEKQRDEAKARGETDGYADLVRACEASAARLQAYLRNRVA